MLAQNLQRRGYDNNLINKAIDKLKSDASLGGGRDLYEANRDVYGLLRYGVKVRPGIGERTKTVWLIDWARPEANHFAIAEEVTVLGQHTKRPDLVLYVNGIALVTLELSARRSPCRRVSGRPSATRSRSSFAHSSRRCSWSWLATMSRVCATE